MSERRARGVAEILCALVLAGSVWLVLDLETRSSDPTAQLAPARVVERLPPTPPLHMPPPFEDRRIRKPDPSEPVPSQTEAFCADENWSRMDVMVSQSDGGEFRVDRAAWNHTMAGSRAGIASWLSTCKRDGESVRIVAEGSGALVATYDPQSGLRSH